MRKGSLLLYKTYGEVATYFKLDKEGNKIPDGFNVHGQPAFEQTIGTKERLDKYC
tara:strand:+ start:668 stop:832 length:165 start_codon:yes stop_codon:yes gene_type:complete